MQNIFLTLKQIQNAHSVYIESEDERILSHLSA